MKYDKQIIVETIERKIKKMQELEDIAQKAREESLKENIAKRDAARAAVVEWLKTWGTATPRTDEDFEELSRAIGTRHTYIGDSLYNKLNDAVMKPRALQVERESEQLKDVLEVFKTGAPPQVGVTDLRGFGLLDFVKYRGSTR